MEDVSLALLMSPANFDAYLIRKATKVQSCAFFLHSIEQSAFSEVAFSAESSMKLLKQLILDVLDASLTSQEQAKVHLSDV